MIAFEAPLPDFTLSLAHAVILSSDVPLLMLRGDLTVMVASTSFCHSFQIDPQRVQGIRLADVGGGEWNVPQLDALLLATASGSVAVTDYEMDLIRPDFGNRCLSINAHKLVYAGDDRIMVLLSISDVTDARRRESRKDSLVREKAVLLAELQHRVANSLQIIASVLLQSARRVQSEETRTHIYDAHHRVMSVAALQHQLALSQSAEVGLQLYLTDLCSSIGASMIGDRATMTITVKADESVVKADASLSLGLIVTELVINCLKHAFPGQRAGSILVSYASVPSGWTLTVQDNGVGMPAVKGDSPAGLGSNIVKALAMQLNATITLTDAKPGTRVTIAHTEIVDIAAMKQAVLTSAAPKPGVLKPAVLKPAVLKPAVLKPGVLKPAVQGLDAV